MATYTFYVKRVQGNEYSVIRYYPGGYYNFQTILGDSGATCNCPSFTNTKKPCRHIAVASAYKQKPTKAGMQWAMSDMT